MVSNEDGAATDTTDLCVKWNEVAEDDKWNLLCPILIAHRAGINRVRGFFCCFFPLCSLALLFLWLTNDTGSSRFSHPHWHTASSTDIIIQLITAALKYCVENPI